MTAHPVNSLSPSQFGAPGKQGGNPVRVAATQDRRKSSAAGTHGDRRTKRNRDRASQKRKAIEEQG